MIKSVYEEETENTETCSNDSLDQLPKNFDNNIPACDRDFCPSVEVLESEKIANEAIKAEELDPTTAGALRLRYRIFNDTDHVRWFPDENKEPWFIADDVCKILGYKNTAKAIADHCGKVIDSKDIDERHCLAKKMTVKDANGQGRPMIAINEPDLYRLIIRSRMPDASKFEHWVMEDVLPSIRKTGKYAVKRKIEFSNPEDQAKFEAAKTELSGQCELFPRMVPSVSLPADITDRLNSVKKRLFEQGHTFPNNKEFVKFLVNKALEDLEG